jgi:hypothetical protein
MKATERTEMQQAVKYSLILLVFSIMALGVVSADPGTTSPSATKPQQIVVLVYQTDKGLRFDLESDIYKGGEYKKTDANYFLAELKLHDGGNCQLIEVVDDRAPLSAITEISEMAINAGFKDIRPFVYWHKTGRMAQVQFGPPIKYTKNAEKIDQRLEKAK